MHLLVWSQFCAPGFDSCVLFVKMRLMPPLVLENDFSDSLLKNKVNGLNCNTCLYCALIILPMENGSFLFVFKSLFLFAPSFILFED